MSGVPPVPQQQQVPNYQPHYGSSEPQTSKLAIAAFICGLVFCVPVFTPLAAIVLGVIALIVIASSNGRTKGNGFAISGIILGLLVGVGQVVLVYGMIDFAGQMAAGPARKVILALESNDFPKARAQMSQTASAATDDELRVFAKQLSEDCGKLLDVKLDIGLQGFAASPQFASGIAVNTNPGAPQVFPVKFEFDRGVYIGAIDIKMNQTATSVSQVYKVDNISIIINSNPVRMIASSGNNATNGAPETVVPEESQADSGDDA